MGDLIIWIGALGKKRDYTHNVVAWGCANLMNMWKGKNAPRITPQKLLGKKTESDSFRDIMRARREVREAELIGGK